MSFYTDEQLSMILSAHEAISWWGRFNYADEASMKELDNICDWLGDTCYMAMNYATINGLLKHLEKRGLA